MGQKENKGDIFYTSAAREVGVMAVPFLGVITYQPSRDLLYARGHWWLDVFISKEGSNCLDGRHTILIVRPLMQDLRVRQWVYSGITSICKVVKMWEIKF